MRSMVAGSAELSRSLFVSRSTDVIGMRHWCDFCVNAQKWREKSSTFRQMSKEREQEVFEENMSERGSLQFGGERENVLKDQREGQATKGRLERKRKGVAVKRSSETTAAFNFLDCFSQKKVSWQYYFYLIVIVHITVFFTLHSYCMLGREFKVNCE